ncbi:MAG: hypothetical protein JXD18_03820 [Anaerolineae bacterium]|nr:hypothetical protein [Anaerolineae bacterium]
MTWNASQRTAPLSEDGSAFIRNVPIHTLISPDSGGARSDVIITFESA